MGKLLGNICVFTFHHLRGDWKLNLYLQYIYLLDVKPAAMLHEENKQYTVKRSELRYNGGILIYSLISSLLRELHDSASLAFNCPSFFLFQSPLWFI